MEFYFDKNSETLYRVLEYIKHPNKVEPTEAIITDGDQTYVVSVDNLKQLICATK
jgi:hypothetical protein